MSDPLTLAALERLAKRTRAALNAGIADPKERKKALALMERLAAKVAAMLEKPVERPKERPKRRT